MANHLFISYSTKDSRIVESLVRALEHRGEAVWIAPRDVRKGADYPDEIMCAISKANAVIVVVSENSSRSRHVVREVAQAADESKLIIPVQIDQAALSPALKYFLAMVQRIDLAEASEKAIEAVAIQVQSVFQAEQLAGLAAEVDQELDRAGERLRSIRLPIENAVAAEKNWRRKIKELRKSRVPASAEALLENVKHAQPKLEENIKALGECRTSVVELQQKAGSLNDTARLNTVRELLAQADQLRDRAVAALGDCQQAARELPALAVEPPPVVEEPPRRKLWPAIAALLLVLGAGGAVGVILHKQAEERRLAEKKAEKENDRKEPTVQGTTNGRTPQTSEPQWPKTIRIMGGVTPITAKLKIAGRDVPNTGSSTEALFDLESIPPGELENAVPELTAAGYNAHQLAKLAKDTAPVKVETDRVVLARTRGKIRFEGTKPTFYKTLVFAWAGTLETKSGIAESPGEKKLTLTTFGSEHLLDTGLWNVVLRGSTNAVVMAADWELAAQVRVTFSEAAVIKWPDPLPEVIRGSHFYFEQLDLSQGGGAGVQGPGGKKDNRPSTHSQRTTVPINSKVKTAETVIIVFDWQTQKGGLYVEATGATYEIIKTNVPKVDRIVSSFLALVPTEQKDAYEDRLQDVFTRGLLTAADPFARLRELLNAGHAAALALQTSGVDLTNEAAAKQAVEFVVANHPNQEKVFAPDSPGSNTAKKMLADVAATRTKSDQDLKTFLRQNSTPFGQASAKAPFRVQEITVTEFGPDSISFSRVLPSGAVVSRLTRVGTGEFEMKDEPSGELQYERFSARPAP